MDGDRLVHTDQEDSVAISLLNANPMIGSPLANDRFVINEDRVFFLLVSSKVK